MSDKTPNKKPHVPSLDPSWLAQRSEPPLPFGHEIVDSHVHLWDFSDPPYYGNAYIQDAQAAGISKAVYVECTMGYQDSGPKAERPVGEVAFAFAQSLEHSSINFDLAAGIVGMVDVTLGSAVRPILEQQIAAGEGRFRGIRIRAAWDNDPAATYGPAGAPPNLLAQQQCRAALTVLQELDLSLDVYLFHTQIADLVDLASAMPKLPIVLNHCGAPLGVGQFSQQRETVWKQWRTDLSRLAGLKNVSIKIGGFAISRVDIVRRAENALPPSSEQLADQFAPWVNHCLEVFGPERCMFGSNFPVDKVAMSLTHQVNAMKRLVEPLGANAAAYVMGKSARRFYRI